MTKYPLYTHNTTTQLTFRLTNKCWRHSCCVEYDHSRWCKKSSHCFHVILNEWCTALQRELGKRRRPQGIVKTGVLYRINFRLVSGKQGQMIQRHRAAVENENNVHPLSRKSLRGIVNTNLANLHELAHDGTEENDDRLLIISQSTSSTDSVIATNTLLPRSRRSKPTQRMRLQMMISFSVWSC